VAAFFRLLKKSPRLGIGISAPSFVVCFFMSTNPLCIFCSNPRTNKRGEHVWDDWLNREGGKERRDPSTTFYYGSGGELIRKHDSIRMDVTVDMVCDSCNSTWMSDLTTRMKDLLEPSIRRDQPVYLDTLALMTLVSFAFMKSAVLDWYAVRKDRTACISRTTCAAFRRSLTSDSFDGSIALPDGLQAWIARYRRTHAMEALAFCEEMAGARQFKGYRILVITYVVGSFIFQLTYPRWAKVTRNRPTAPFFQVIGDVLSAPIWPGVDSADWPPLLYVESRTLESFRERFRRIRVPLIS
jgi:hypothetical protein